MGVDICGYCKHPVKQHTRHTTPDGTNTPGPRYRCRHRSDHCPCDVLADLFLLNTLTEFRRVSKRKSGEPFQGGKL